MRSPERLSCTTGIARKCWPSVIEFAHNREDAEDMLQEGFIKVFSQIHTFQNKGAFEGWIRRIIVHTCINNLKKNKRFNESLDIVYAQGVQVWEESVPSIVTGKTDSKNERILPIDGYRTVLNLYVRLKAILTGRSPGCWISKRAQAARNTRGQSKCWRRY